MTDDLRGLTARIVIAHVGNNAVAPADLPRLIESVHGALRSALTPVELPKQEPAAPIRSSVKPDYVISLESGRKMKMLKRYLRTTYGMSPEDYRAKWGLPADYPMTAPNYRRQRSDIAKRAGLGRRPPETVIKNEAVVVDGRSGGPAHWPGSDNQDERRDATDHQLVGDELTHT